MKSIFKSILVIMLFLSTAHIAAQETRLLRQPTINGNQIAYTYGSDVWTTNLTTNLTTRLTSTAALKAIRTFLQTENGLRLHQTGLALQQFILFRLLVEKPKD